MEAITLSQNQTILISKAQPFAPRKAALDKLSRLWDTLT